MNEKKAIEWLKVIRELQNDGIGLNDRREALDIAIKCLEDKNRESSEKDITNAAAENMKKVEKLIELEKSLKQCFSNESCLDLPKVTSILHQYLEDKENE